MPGMAEYANALAVSCSVSARSAGAVMLWRSMVVWTWGREVQGQRLEEGGRQQLTAKKHGSPQNAAPPYPLPALHPTSSPFLLLLPYLVDCRLDVVERLPGLQAALHHRVLLAQQVLHLDWRQVVDD